MQLIEKKWVYLAKIGGSMKKQQGSKLPPLGGSTEPKLPPQPKPKPK
jgi:hypothetical protein